MDRNEMLALLEEIIAQERDDQRRFARFLRSIDVSELEDAVEAPDSRDRRRAA